jgi:hypothetical protein
MSSSSPYLKLYEQFKEKVKNDKSLERKILNDFTILYHDIYTHSMKSDKNYCHRFIIPTAKVLKIFQIVGFTEQDLDNAVTTEWQLPKEVIMRHDPYYQILTFLIYYGIKNNNDKLVKLSYIFMLIRLWNGRLGRFLKYCDEKIMKYVITYMGSNRHLFKKYPSPFNLINDYFIPTILSKYEPIIKNNYLKLNTLLDQGHDRIKQIFVYNPIVNIQSGKKEASGGILYLYIKAKNENLYLSTPKISEEQNYDEYITINNRETIIQQTCNEMSMNPNPTYAQDFIKSLNERLTISVKSIELILKALHKYDYYDLIQEILLIMLAQLKINVKTELCSTNFYTLVDRNIISSKNNKDSKKLQELINNLLVKIFDDVIHKKFDSFSNVQQIKLRNLIILGLAYNLRKINCHHKK